MLSLVEQIKDRLDIVDLIGSYIKLDKAGRNYKARCPFHNEKTPSFIVSPERQTFYCFGCQAKGDAFSFIEKFEGLELKDALKMLAERTGVELRKFGKEELGGTSKKEKLLKALEDAAQIYVSQLANETEVRKYLDKRGLAEETIKKWRIGWAPQDWRILYEKLKAKGYSDEELLGVGLIKPPPEKGKRPYDVFRGRVMFPIFDISGRVIAFSGRIFKDDGRSPKYVNTPETEIFKKSEVLYGLHEAKTEIRRLDYTVLVEGQVDLVMSHQAGVKNTVASSGTALTESHLKKIQKLSNRCIIAYDSDDAGRAAARRSGELALSLGMEVKIAALPEGEDPASIILKSSEEWKEVLKNSVMLVEFAVDEVVRQTLGRGKKNLELIKEFNRSVIPLLASLQSEMLRSEWVSVASRKTKISEKSIWSDLESYQKNFKESGEVSERLNNEDYILSPEDIVAGVVLLGFTEKSYKSDEIRERLEKILGKEAAEEILENSRFDKETLIYETEARLQGHDPNTVAHELLDRIEKRVLERRLSETAREIDEVKEAKKKEELKKEAQEISNKLKNLYAKK